MVKAKGEFHAVCRNPDGSVAWQEKIDNTVVTSGLNTLLTQALAGGSQLTPWYCGLIDNSGFSAIAAADTPSSHSGWTESQAYSQATRQQWTVGSASSGALTSNANMTFSINATVTIQGAFIISSSTKGGTTGTLFSAGSFNSTKICVSGQTLTFTYTVTLANG